MSRSLPIGLRLYRLGASVLGLAAPLFLAVRRARGKEDGARIGERHGIPGLDRPGGPLFWLHGASVGETLTVLPLAERLVARGCTVLVTSGTVTSAAVLARRLPPGCLHQFVPLDVPAFVRRFLRAWRPDVAIFVESELWPVMITEAHRHRVPLVLVNGRMSSRSFARWRRLPRTIAALLGRFDLCLAQSAADAERFAALAAPRVSAPGNLKFDAAPLPFDGAALARLQATLRGRPVWVAASTHEGEEAIAAAVHARVRSGVPDLLTIIVPRHPERGDAIADVAAGQGFNVLQRSRGFEPDRGVEIYVADTVGELGLFYRLARIVFVGGSLVRHGGQNPAEAARLGAAVLHGPHTGNFVDAYAALDRHGGAAAVADGDALAAEVERLLVDPAAVGAMAAAGERAVAGLAGALDRVVGALDPYLVHLALSGSRR
ncbi:3-deoxy-D-manno-octulosonic acid transferase [Labrys wisconsinensis]|uniref:3-deoxy-D-manno-octulosonic acid transferase n=1 Tax=Labrys wisconsinensis TaxID=425677 RepID=A0ABU0J848_9HYPH|nr:3-deoxy-D-manno-octulosonic acid transferase [Labrys wisconsinensis]MDQ0470448.1 3-deoxy-D-manno-octulosonic-acid transferase [Labrys wisconsinensis]